MIFVIHKNMVVQLQEMFLESILLNKKYQSIFRVLFKFKKYIASELDKVDDQACVTCERWHNMIAIPQTGHGS